MILKLSEKLSIDKISELRMRLKNFLISNGLESETADDIELVISEMLTNIYKHSYKGNEGDVVINANIDDEKVYISIRDFGEKFAPAEISEPDPEVLADHGYGLYIASQIMDKIEYILSHESGTEVILTKYLKKNG
ncbi:serine/threonine-protein kinase RsbW [Candidatus Kryptonium thompsonii]|uniref:Serine/threonine-protein kinase RsbW n=2 Tax=Candidatus Kryptonium thompsonii TaxID=1633631 RepID=A0A0P1P8Z7_9BACT|nr:ATP-binding protein [Candidatus Kryptonium thompsoni]CUS79124.1 serine/threonine-protein kinase RsbW [Candidatus Kryptonium thompsoni]CUS83780.1 serine/threonine-protein kinase RsbW [Candidatus Kryptonium thompsoni]CUS94656.1 serine/threonine-protein kinase RsbW [Candidatus Kryptonium thompsoni]CUS95468.1 serine/threonine-protein kinase RsbW [Candidatus Kryptonium thompsoni]CUT02838.1 serine/threonine-protein kinase RsbW [Candidatus Kryptonium thompsoni]